MKHKCTLITVLCQTFINGAPYIDVCANNNRFVIVLNGVNQLVYADLPTAIFHANRLTQEYCDFLNMEEQGLPDDFTSFID